MAIQSSTQPKVVVADKVREFYKVNKKLGGLITVTETIYTERVGRELLVVFPKLDKYDRVLINGIEYKPEKGDRDE